MKIVILTLESVIGSGARFIPQMPATAAMRVSPAAITVTMRSRATKAFRLQGSHTEQPEQTMQATLLS